MNLIKNYLVYFNNFQYKKMPETLNRSFSNGWKSVFFLFLLFIMRTTRKTLKKYKKERIMSDISGSGFFCCSTATVDVAPTQPQQREAPVSYSEDCSTIRFALNLKVDEHLLRNLSKKEAPSHHYEEEEKTASLMKQTYKDTVKKISFNSANFLSVEHPDKLFDCFPHLEELTFWNQRLTKNIIYLLPPSLLRLCLYNCENTDNPLIFQNIVKRVARLTHLVLDDISKELYPTLEEIMKEHNNLTISISGQDAHKKIEDEEAKVKAQNELALQRRAAIMGSSNPV